MAFTNVIVGVDDSQESQDALIWALVEARLRNLPVHAIHVWEASGTPQEVERLAALTSVDDLRTEILEKLTFLVRTAAGRADANDVAVTPQVLYGHPAQKLIGQTRRDSLLVVGSRGRSSVVGSLLGSVSQTCAQYAEGAVVVVRGDRPNTGSGRVVVGVDGSVRSQRALRFADEAASLRGATLQVVHAWTMPYLGFGGPAHRLPAEVVDEIAAQASRTLHSSIRQASVDASKPTVELSLVTGPAAPSLLQAAENADLLVVGSRGHGGWKGLLLGSVSAQSITRSPCSVLVVRDADDDTEDPKIREQS